MAFDNQYPSRKDQRRQYRDGRAVDRTCRCHGRCSWCASSRKAKHLRRMPLTILALLLLVVGCGLPSVGPLPVNPIKPPAKAETVWSVVAEYIDAGRIDNTDTLILVVDRLRETDAITDLDRAKFDAAMPGIKAKRRVVTSEDARVLEGLK